MATTKPPAKMTTGQALTFIVVVISFVLYCNHLSNQPVKAPQQELLEQSKAQNVSHAQEPSSTPKEQKEEPQQVTEKKPISISSAALMAAYDRNEVEADDNYKGKRLRVTGLIERIGKAFLDGPYVVLTPDGDDDRFAGVQCVFSADDTKALGKLRKKHHLTIEGECDGKLMNVLLRDSKIIE